MNLRASIDPPSQAVDAAAWDPGRCRLEVFDTLTAAGPAWQHLQGADCLGTAYQQQAWMQAWQRHVGQANGVRPCIVAGFDDGGAPAFLWPLGRKTVGPLEVASFLGGKHANLNWPLWRRDLAGAVTAAGLSALLHRLRAAGPRVDLMVLQNQPEAWEGTPNPFLVLAHQPSPSPAFRGALGPDFEAILRARIGKETGRKLRQKERALARRGALAFRRADTDGERRRVLEAFFAQKALRMAELGLDNVFAEPGVRAFIEAAALGGALVAERPIELYAAFLDDEILATFGGIASSRRFSGMFNSMVQGGLAADSPGEILLSHVVRMACERGLDTFDLGVGDAGYKRGFCDEEEPLFDSVIGLTAPGRAAAPLWRARLRSKGAIKRSALWRWLVAARRRRGKAAVQAAGRA